MNDHPGPSSFDTFLGVTEAEQYLSKLCDRTFLRLWSHTGLHRDQTAGSGDDYGKEICDLLVVFEDHMIVFSDKDCAYPDSGDPVTDWCRWYKRAVRSSARQLHGAERWLSEHPDRIFQDPECTQPFPYAIPSADHARVHLVAVCHNTIPACRAFFGGGSGSLMLAPQIQGKEHWRRSSRWTPIPFHVGDFDPARTFIHVLDDVTVNVLLNYLDTISDLVGYLDRKENLIRSGKLVSASGEEDLLAYYLQRLNPQGEHDFLVEDADGITVVEGWWPSFLDSREFRGKTVADERSYAWDNLIEHLSGHIVTGNLVGDSSPFADQEPAIRVLARESRLARRGLAEALLDFAATPPDNELGFKARVVRRIGETTYVFVVASLLEGESEEEFRERRRKTLVGYCLTAKVRWPEIGDILGLAIMPKGSERSSEDLVFISEEAWDAELEAEAQSLAADAPILREVEVTETTDHEFPPLDVPAATRSGRPGRNDPCHCGSGKKYKNCCWLKDQA